MISCRCTLSALRVSICLYLLLFVLYLLGICFYLLSAFSACCPFLPLFLCFLSSVACLCRMFPLSSLLSCLYAGWLFMSLLNNTFPFWCLSCTLGFSAASLRWYPVCLAVFTCRLGFYNLLAWLCHLLAWVVCILCKQHVCRLPGCMHFVLCSPFAIACFSLLFLLGLCLLTVCFLPCL